jgi:hypothetical protein
LEVSVMEANGERARREQIVTRIDSGALATIERLAEQRRTTPAQVARVILEDGVRAIAGNAAEAA